MALRALTSDEAVIVEHLQSQLTQAQPALDSLDAYYDGAQRLEQLGLAIPDQLLRFTVVVNWPRTVVDATADRLDVKGFRLPGLDVGDQELLDLWRTSGMDEQDQAAKLDYLIFGRTYKCIGANEDDPSNPLITVESPRSIITERDVKTGRVTSALRLYDQVNGRSTRGTLYLPNETVYLDGLEGPWMVEDVDEHGLGRVPVVPTFRRRRTRIPVHRSMQGVSAMADIIPITDAAARNLSNAQVAQETHAVPQRGVLGATKGDFVGADGQPLTTWEAYFGAVWAMGNPNAKTFQFDASDMVNFERMMDLYARLGSGVSALPPNYFGLAADDAASADAIRSREARHVKVAERDQVALGMGDAEALRIAARIRDGVWDPDLAGLETLWYDAGTPTTAQRADAVVKMYTATDSRGRSLLPVEAAYEELGYSPTKIARLLAMRAREDEDPVVERIANSLIGGGSGAAVGD